MSDAALRANGEVRIQGLDAGQVRAALRQHNPLTPLGEIRTVTEIVLLVFDFIAGLPKSGRREIVREKAQFRAALEEATQSIVRTHIEDTGQIERSRGAGLGPMLSLKEGREQLARYAIAIPMEEWAGPVAGAGEIEKTLGVARSTLASWYQQGAVIGLLRGQRKRAYPLEQFVDARPLEGLMELLRIAPDGRSAWLWARQAHGALDGGTPLELLRAGRKREVILAAERDFAIKKA